MNAIKCGMVFTCSCFVCASILVATLFWAHAEQDRARKHFNRFLSDSENNLCATILAARRSPFWAIPAGKDVIWRNLELHNAKIRLLRPCRIEIDGARFAVSLELWIALDQLSTKEDLDNDGNQTPQP